MSLSRHSKFLSLVLRHKPDLIGIELDTAGWTEVSTLLERLNTRGNTIDYLKLEEIVANNNKKRFEFNEDKTKIRASQGHSIDVDLGYEEKKPPSILYHGTAKRFINSILNKGILKGNRHHEHLSSTKETAKKVGQRHGKVAIIYINAEKMYEDGHKFFVSTNGVWLTETVPSEYIRFIQENFDDR